MSSCDIASGIGYLTQAEVDAIKEVAALLPTNPVCVNIGAGAGTSSIALLEAREDAHLTDIDIDPGNGISQMREAGYYDADRYERITADSALFRWEGKPLDYLFVDGDHSERGITGDIENWIPHMAQGAYILFHDYHPYPRGHALEGINYWPDVRRVCDKLIGYPVAWDCDRLRVYQVK